MDSTDALTQTLDRTHDDLAARLRSLRFPDTPPDGPRASYIGLDSFLAAASQHLHAVDAVLLPAACRALPDGRHRAREHLASAKRLEVELVHVKGHAYGSVYEHRHDWGRVWPDVEQALDRERESEQHLAAELADQLDEDDLTGLAEELYEAGTRAPSRPHPYLPHSGRLGAVARAVVRRVDAFWDTAEGRMTPAPVPPPRPVPGLLSRYLTGDPWFDATDPELAAREQAQAEAEGAGGMRARGSSPRQAHGDRGGGVGEDEERDRC